MSSDQRLVEIVSAFRRVGIRFLVMGGHAVRHYGVSRDTLDFDFHLSLSERDQLIDRLRETGLFKESSPSELPGWRGPDFRRFQLGRLESGREEWLEFWFRNHLLPSFDELFARRESAEILGTSVPFLSLPDLIRSKETERESDWQDVALLEEILDARNLASAGNDAEKAAALSKIRSRRGFRRAESDGLFENPAVLLSAYNSAQNPITRAFLMPFVSKDENREPADLPAFILASLRSVLPGSPRHLALVEAVRRIYRQNAIMADREDKQRALRERA